MKRIKKINVSMLLYSLIALVLGVLMYRFPLKVIGAVGYVMAVAILVLAIKLIVEFIRKQTAGKYYQWKIIVGILLIIAAVFVALKANTIKVFLIYLIGLSIIFSAFLKVEGAFYLKKMKEHWIPVMVLALVWLMVGIFVLQLPPNVSDTSGLGSVILGIALSLNGLSDLIYTVFISPKIVEYKMQQYEIQQKEQQKEDK